MFERIKERLRGVSERLGGPPERRNLLGYGIDVVSSIVSAPVKIVTGTWKLAKMMFTDPALGAAYLRYQTSRLGALVTGLLGVENGFWAAYGWGIAIYIGFIVDLVTFTPGASLFFWTLTTCAASALVNYSGAMRRVRRVGRFDASYPEPCWLRENEPEIWAERHRDESVNPTVELVEATEGLVRAVQAAIDRATPSPIGISPERHAELAAERREADAARRSRPTGNTKSRFASIRDELAKETGGETEGEQV